MPLQKTGAITLSEIQTEFGGSNPVSLNEYYRSGSIVTSPYARGQDNALLPSSGQISMSQFRGARNGYYMADNYTYSPGGTNATVLTQFLDTKILASGNHAVITPAGTHTCVLGMTANIVSTIHTVGDPWGATGYANLYCDREASAACMWNIGSNIYLGYFLTIGRVYQADALARYGVVWESLWCRFNANTNTYEEYWANTADYGSYIGASVSGSIGPLYNYFSSGTMRVRLSWNGSNYEVYCDNGTNAWFYLPSLSYGTGRISGAYSHPISYTSTNMYYGAFQHYNSGSNSRTVSNVKFSRDTTTIYSGFGY